MTRTASLCKVINTFYHIIQSQRKTIHKVWQLSIKNTSMQEVLPRLCIPHWKWNTQQCFTWTSAFLWLLHVSS